MAVDDLRTVADAEQVGDGSVFVETIGFFFANHGPCVFNNARALCDGCSGIAAGSMDGGGANNEAHKVFEAEPMEYNSQPVRGFVDSMAAIGADVSRLSKKAIAHLISLKR